MEQSNLNTVEYTCIFFTASVDLIEEVLLDWLEFLSPSPTEVLVAVGYYDEIPQFWSRLVDQGLVTRVIPYHLKNLGPREVCIDALMTLMRESKNNWVMSINMDVLPYREGHENWLQEAYEHILRDDSLIGFTGSFRSRFIEHYTGKYFQTKNFSTNFGFLRRDLWLGVVEKSLEMASVCDPEFDKQLAVVKNRYIPEHAIESYLFYAGKCFLFRDEDASWTVFHVNQWAEKLAPIRQRFKKRIGIHKYLNKGSRIEKMPWQMEDSELYYGAKHKPLKARIKGRLKKIYEGLFR